MRVLHITRDLAPVVVGGISTAVAGMIRAARRAGFECAAVSFDRWRPASSAHQPTAGPQPDPDHILRVRGLDDLAPAYDFACRWQPQLLHVHHSTLWTWAAGLQRHLGVPVVKTIHVLQAVLDEQRGVSEPTRTRQQQEQALAEADRVLAPSRACAEDLLRRYPAVRDRLRVTPLGIDPSPAADAAVAARRISLPPPQVLHVGRFDAIKGTDLLLEMIPRVLEREPSARFVIAGGVPANARSERRWHRQWQAMATPAARARCELTGWLSPLEREALAGRSALLVAPSRYETFGLAVLEAMQFGLPVIATATGALSELVNHDTGRPVPAGNAAALTDAVVELLQAPRHARTLGLAGAEKVRNRHLWIHTIQALTEVYREVTDEAVQKAPSGGSRR